MLFFLLFWGDFGETFVGSMVSTRWQKAPETLTLGWAKSKSPRLMTLSRFYRCANTVCAIQDKNGVSTISFISHVFCKNSPSPGFCVSKCAAKITIFVWENLRVHRPLNTTPIFVLPKSRQSLSPKQKKRARSKAVLPKFAALRFAETEVPNPFDLRLLGRSPTYPKVLPASSRRPVSRKSIGSRIRSP